MAHRNLLCIRLDLLRYLILNSGNFFQRASRRPRREESNVQNDNQHGQTNHWKHHRWSVVTQNRKKDKGHDRACKPAESIRSSGGSGAKSGGEDLALQDMEAAREDIAEHSVRKSKDQDRSGRFGISETESKHSHQER